MCLPPSGSSSAPRRAATRRDGKRRVADDLGVLDRRLAAFEQPPQMHGRQEPPDELGEAEERAVALGVPRRAPGLRAVGGRQRAEAAPEVQPDVGLGLGAPAERARPAVRVEEQREREHRPEEAGDDGGEATGGRAMPRSRGPVSYANVAATAALAVAAGGAAWSALAATGGGGSTLHACAARRTGALRLVHAGQHCRRSERAVRWAVRGPAGAT